MIQVPRHLYILFLVMAFLWPFVLNGCHWLYVHLNQKDAVIAGILYMLVFFIVEYRVSKPLFRTHQSN